MPTSATQQVDTGHVLSPAAIRGLELTDAMPRLLRECVHEFGFSIVHAFVQLGVDDPRHIRHLVTTCWQGPRSTADRNVGGLRGQLDAILIQSGSELSAKGLVRILRQTGYVIVPLEPVGSMVDASIEATGEMGLVSKREKHQGRLRAALRAGAVRLWPGLFGLLLLLSLPAHAEPYTLITIWPSGHVKHEPATTRASCELAMTDALDGFAMPLDEMMPATAAHCLPVNSFKPGWDTIPGFNAPRKR